MSSKLMRLILLANLALLAAPAVAATTPAPAVEPELKTNRDFISYGLGVQTGRNIKTLEDEVDLDVMMRGIKDAMGGGKLLVKEKQLRQIMGTYMADIRRKQAGNRQVAGEDNRKKGLAFFAENAKKPGVVTLPSGVQYRILKAADGPRPTLQDRVQVNYRGTRLDGYEFDASADDHPAMLDVGQLIAGWKEALQLMSVGSKWEIFIPAKHGYGARGAGQDIGPNETLLFEVELVGIK